MGITLKPLTTPLNATPAGWTVEECHDLTCHRGAGPLAGVPSGGHQFFSPGRWLLSTLKSLLLFLCKAPVLTATKSSTLESHRLLLSHCYRQGIKRGLRT